MVMKEVGDLLLLDTVEVVELPYCGEGGYWARLISSELAANSVCKVVLHRIEANEGAACEPDVLVLPA